MIGLQLVALLKQVSEFSSRFSDLDVQTVQPLNRFQNIAGALAFTQIHGGSQSAIQNALAQVWVTTLVSVFQIDVVLFPVAFGQAPFVGFKIAPTGFKPLANGLPR